ncbi:hypothetical protein FQR65_LT05708 [Abscondita terminalis]|nr:hypothetical protein FQR65_LT05708 [Abscondita terminalis]
MTTCLYLITCTYQLYVNESDEKNISFDKYFRYDEIQEYLIKLSINYGDIVSVENYGLSYENRNLTLIKISTGALGKRPLIFLDAGMHAREWLAPSQALYIIQQLVENHHNRRLIENIDWIVIPVVNPDGYEYTHTTDRQWRKTRSKGTYFNGVDLNRNFGFHWSNTNIEESSIFYPGPEPFSEPEARALRDVISKYAQSIKLYLSLHSAAQSFLYPWGFTSKPPENIKELHDLALNVSKTIYDLNKIEYKVGSSFEILGSVNGSSRDWVYGVANIPLTYTIELIPYVNVDYEYRHEMPPERILSIVPQMFEGLSVSQAH